MVDLVILVALLVITVGAIAVALLLWWRSRQRTRRISEKVRITGRVDLRGLQQRLQALAEVIPRRRSLTYRDFPAIQAAATIEAWLLQQKPQNALAAAQIALRSDPRDWRVRLHLARTLFYCEEMEAAARELVKARLLGDTSPAQDYLEARIRLASAELACLRDGDLPEDVELRLQMEAFEALDMLLNVVERDPRFGDAAFHASLLAIRLGLEDEGRILLRQLEPLMDVSPERDRYLTEIERLN